MAAFVFLTLAVVATATLEDSSGSRGLLVAEEAVADEGKAVYIAKTRSDIQAGQSLVAGGEQTPLFWLNCARKLAHSGVVRAHHVRLPGGAAGTANSQR